MRLLLFFLFFFFWGAQSVVCACGSLPWEPPTGYQIATEVRVTQTGIRITVVTNNCNNTGIVTSGFCIGFASRQQYVEDISVSKTKKEVFQHLMWTDWTGVVYLLWKWQIKWSVLTYVGKCDRRKNRRIKLWNMIFVIGWATSLV
jgi:hypothetical protein